MRSKRSKKSKKNNTRVERRKRERRGWLGEFLFETGAEILFIALSPFRFLAWMGSQIARLTAWIF